MLIYYSFIETPHCRAAVKLDRSVGGRLLQLKNYAVFGKIRLVTILLVEDFYNWDIMPYLER